MPNKRHWHMQQKKMINSLEDAVPCVSMCSTMARDQMVNVMDAHCYPNMVGAVGHAHFPLNWWTNFIHRPTIRSESALN